MLQSSVPAVPGLPFDLITNPADTTEDPVLYIGGVPNDLGIAAIPQGDTFMGCLQDLAFNFRYIASTYCKSKLLHVLEI